ncbi:hypothetical protein FNI11_15065 [Salmonella enterica subsp. salamae]|nr:hypothetical protein [Salmonella enterica subsp. salamae]ECJ2281836.1 hypothetical protein [Salmonella enterica subsp. salamae]HCC0888689.1 hypothetical protein [Salmonella enterica]
MRIITNAVPGSDIADVEIYDNATDRSHFFIKGKLRHVENEPKDLLISVPTRSEWLFYWGKEDKYCIRHRARKKVKYYVTNVKPKKHP